MPVRKSEGEGAFVNIGVPRPLAEDMDRFLAEHPEFGIMGRNELTRRAISDLLHNLREEVQNRLAMEAYREGKPGPFFELKRMRKVS